MTNDELADADILEHLAHFERHQLRADDEYGAEVLHRARMEIRRLRAMPEAFKCGICGGADVGCTKCRAMPEGERDHKAMEVLRGASLKRGWQWRWDEPYQLEQIPVEPSVETHKDPADAILNRKCGP